MCHLVDNSACDAHAVENGHIDDGGHSSIVDGLRAVRPHVRTFCQVDVAGRKTRRRQRRERMLYNSVCAETSLLRAFCLRQPTRHAETGLNRRMGLKQLWEKLMT